MVSKIRHKRGSMYITVLAAATLVSVIGLAATLLGRIRQQTAQTVAHTNEAQPYAQAAIELALAMIDANDNWRSLYPNGTWINGQGLYHGRIWIDVTDPLDDDLADDVCDEFVIRGTSTVKDAQWIAEVEAAPAGEPNSIAERRPIAYWPLQDTQGTVAYEAMRGYHGTYKNGVSLAAARGMWCDNAPYFDGSNDFVEIAHRQAFKLHNGTVLLWFQPKVVSSYQGLFSRDSLGFDNGGHFGIWYASGNIYVRLQSTANNYELTSSSLNTGTWHFVVVTFGDQGLALYTDGVLADSDPYTGGLGDNSGGVGNNEPITIGVDQSSSGDGTSSGWLYPFRGNIAHVAVFNYALDATAVAEMYLEALDGQRILTIPGTWRRVIDED